MRTIINVISAIIITSVAITSCHSEIDEDSAFCSIPAQGWAYGDTLSFEPELSESIAEGHIAVMVRHSSSYVFGNLWLELTVPPAPGDSVPEVDTINVILANDYGKWLGRGSGVSYVKVDTISGLHIIKHGSPVTLRHIMRVDTVEGLEQIGVIFLK